MLLIRNESHDPAFNLALEEYALTQMKDDMILLWRNGPAVIIGRNQNAIAEIDLDYVKENDITVIRRQSGGGAVFHDLGNINFTIIQSAGQEEFANYEKFTQPVVEFLQSIGVNAQLIGRNDLLVDGAKVSGNAQAYSKGRIMHHGTLLFDADMQHLSKALIPHPAKIKSHQIASNKSRVTNIASHLPTPMSVEEFFDKLYDYFLMHGEHMEEYSLSPHDLAQTNQLVTEKYSQWDWNIGYAAAYNYQNDKKFPFGIVELHLQVEQGIIREAKIYGDFFGKLPIQELSEHFVEKKHDKDILRPMLEALPLNDYISGMTVDDFMTLI